MAAKDKSMWILIVFIFAGIVIGGLIGDLASKSTGLWWLAYGQEFGLNQPLSVDLSIIKFSFSLMIKLNISSILGMILAVFIYRKV